tara:strand:- start:124 stop:627 length:504 start_codon:yes stop_codon:yes gene_type:complete
MRIFLILVSALGLGMMPTVSAFADGDGSSSRNGNRIQAGFTLNDEGEVVTDDDDAHEEVVDNPRTVILPAIATPLIVDNRLMGYAYTQVRFQVSDGHDAWDVRENAHYALDALIRASHRESIATEDGRSIDQELAIAIWMQALSDYYGPDVVENLMISTPDTRMLRR